MQQQKFYHDNREDSLSSARAIVPVVYSLLQPKSVVDLGCGSGSFLSLFKQMGVTEVLGLDGSWANKELIYQYLSPSEFQEVDLEDFSVNNRRFDLAINLEVAEHLAPASASRHVENLTKLSDVILFSAAIPSQGGQNHVNEQWPSYWAKKFADHGYVFADVLRPIFWQDERVKYWYRQNLFLVVKKGVQIDYNLLEQFRDPSVIMDCVHPVIYGQKLASIERIKNLDIKAAWRYFVRKLSK